MKKFVLCCLLAGFTLVIPQALWAGSSLEQADALYDQGGLENFKKAIDLYLVALKDNPGDYETNWKCARAYRDFGNISKRQKVEGWKKICAEYGKKGMEYAKKAIDITPDKPDAHYYYGISVGIYSDGVSIITALREGLKGKTQSSFEKAYELDKMYNDAGPILSLGRFWAVLPWPLKDKKASLKYYREYQKTSYFADSDEAHIFIAELLMDIGGQENKAEARTLLEKAAEADDPYFSDWAGRLLK
jgi:tetratricopeptide (TPR) repeat protein